jgi:alpha-glucosidase
MPMVADEPSAYEGEPGFDFIVDVPTTWDETRFVAGEPGEYIVVARRSGATWYLGGITNWTQRKLKLPLAFLGDGSYEARLYLDDSPDGKEPNKIREETRLVKSDKRLDVSLAAGGGVAAVIRPK